MFKTLLVNLRFGQSKLATTRRPNNLRDLRARKQLHKPIRILDRGGVSLIVWSLAEIASGFEFPGTADAPSTAQIHITSLLDEVEVEMGDGDNRVVERVIDMPLVAAAVQEDRYFREGPITIDNIAMGEKKMRN